MNCQSVKNKKAEFHTIVDSAKPDIILGNESWLRPRHTLPDSATGRVTDSKILCPFVSVRMRFLSVPHAVNAFRVR